MIIVTTAKSGQALRDYAFTRSSNPRVAVFPESGLSASEEAQWLEQEMANYDEVITFSPFIISDAPKGSLSILDSAQICIEHGDHIQKVLSKLGYRGSIGTLAKNKIDKFEKLVKNANSTEEIDLASQELISSVGESIERVLALKGSRRQAQHLMEVLSCEVYGSH